MAYDVKREETPDGIYYDNAKPAETPYSMSRSLKIATMLERICTNLGIDISDLK